MVPADTIFSKNGLVIKNGVLYVGNGIKWSLVTGAGSTPDLQAVVAAGNSTDNALRITDVATHTLGYASLYQSGGQGRLDLANGAGPTTSIFMDSIAHRDSVLKFPTRAGTLALRGEVTDSMYAVLNNISLVSRIDTIYGGTSSTFVSSALIGKQVLSCKLEGYELGFLTRPTAYMSFNSSTGTITLTNATFSADDQVIILYRTTPVFLTDGSGNYIKDSNGNYIILN